MYRPEVGLYETRLANKILLKVYFLFWIPMRIIMYALIAMHAYFYISLYKEESELFLSKPKSAVCITNLLLIAHVTILMHFVILKKLPARITEPKFLELEKRFTKDQINQFSPELKKLLSYSHCTEDDLKRFLNTGEREHEIIKCKICNEIKIYSMAHCKSCNKCVFRYDHHCPWFNNCIGAHNINYYCSFLVYCSLLIVMNLIAFTCYYTSETYNAHYIIYRCLIAFNILCLYFVGGLTAAFLFFVGNGRSLSEIILELIVNPFPPKYKLYTNWRENAYVVFGTWHIVIALLLPYFFGPAITGLEFGFLPPNRDPDDFLGEMINFIKNWWYRGKRQFKRI